MALVKCKECGEEVSTKAKTCPKCGAKAPKKTSLFTWLVLLFIGFVVYAANQAPTSTSSASSYKSQNNLSESSTKSEPVKVAPPQKPSWRTSSSKDKMTGKASSYANSPRANPTKMMSFPYSDVSSWMGVGCDGEDEWVYFGFNNAPNLANDETKDGYSLISTRVKWDDEIENVSLTQDWSAKFIHFRNDASAIEKIAASNEVLLELQWHGQQGTYFEYSLNGSSKALKKIRSECSK